MYFHLPRHLNKKGIPDFEFPLTTLHAYPFFPIRATGTDHLVLLDLIVQKSL